MRFLNAAALEPIGSCLYGATSASGTPRIGSAGSDDPVGQIQQCHLERSNVDCAAELHELDRLADRLTTLRSAAATIRRAIPESALPANSAYESIAIPLDVTDPGSVETAADRTAASLGSLDILINNSGVAPSDAAIDVDEATWDRCLDTNLKGAWLVAQACARRMIRGGKGGVIVNIASILSVRVQKGTAPYAISKAGLLQMTKALALEWARYGIRVNALAPGYIETDISRAFLQSEPGQRMMKAIPQRRFGQAEDLDGALLFLAGDASQYVTGVFLPVDGGHTLALA